MKLQIKILFILVFSSVFPSCTASDGASNTAPNPAAVQLQYGTPFDKMPNKEDAIIYQVNIRAFSAEGTLKGVQNRLSAIHDLGANVIYLMPIYPVGILRSAGGLGSPYAVKDYKAVNTDFGSLEDLRVLVAEAHKMDMAVVLDWVANHTAWDNAWITNHPDWYQKGANGAIIIPPGTNYNDVAQLNYNNAEMRAAMIDAMSYWVYNANIDGFRCDYADYVPESFWTEAIRSLRKIKNQPLLMLAEGTKVAHFASGFDYTFGFNFFGAMEKVFSEGKSAKSLEDSNAIEYAYNYSDSQRVVRYTSNHDVNVSEGTPLALFGGKKGSVAAFVVAAYLKSVPMIYNGQEIGYDKKIEFFTRTPINWASADASMLAEYTKIIAFRKTSNAIKKGSYTGFSSTAVSVFTMESAGEKVLVLSNLTNVIVSYPVPASLSSIAWKDAFSDSAFSVGSTISLQPYQYIVLKG